MKNRFHKFSAYITRTVGSVYALLTALLVIVGWLLTGPFFGFSDTWQLFINTTTTIITFLMVFVIQHSSNRDLHTIQLKLDEIVIAIEKADNNFAGLEEASDEIVLEAEEEILQAKQGVEKNG